MAKIMLVGLGGTGSRIVVEVEKLISQLPEETRKDISLATLGIDTHDQYLSEIKDPVSSLQINTDVQTLVKNIDQFPHIKDFWNPAINPRDTSNGAGGVRILSKVSVYRQAEKIYNRVGNALDKLAAIKGSGDIYVFVVGSLYGGTGSGAYIDVANIITNKLRENLASTDFRIIGHFFLPSILPARTDRNFENAYASLMEYEHIIKQGTYKTSYNRSMTNFSVDLPYHNFFIISGFTHDNLTLPHKPENFYYLVAHKLYYEIISQTLFREFMGKLIDVHILADSFEYSSGVKKPTAFSSFGLSVISYPFDNIRRYFAYRLASEMLSAGFLADYQREDAERDVQDFISKTGLDRLGRAVRQDKNVAFDADQLRFNKSDYDRQGVSLDRLVDDLHSDYQAMKTTKFDRFYKTVQKTTAGMKKAFKETFVSELKRLIKINGINKARTFIELLTGELFRLERKYNQEFQKFERISDEAALEGVSKELDDVKIKVKTWWPIFKRRKVMTEVDEFIDEANEFVEANMSEIINEYSSRYVTEVREFIQRFFRIGGKDEPKSGFLERVKLQAESLRRKYENTYKEVATYIRQEKGRQQEYRVVQNLLSLDELKELFNSVEYKPSERYNLFTNEYMPDMMLDAGRISTMDENILSKELDRFNLEAMTREFSEYLVDFAYRLFDDEYRVMKPENVINNLSEEEIVDRIDELVKYCSPFLGYKRDIARIKRVENTMILIRKAAYDRVVNRIKDKYGSGYFFLATDDVDFLMITKYVHGYDLNSITEMDAITRKYKALRIDEREKRHSNKNFLGKMEPLLVKDVKVVSDDAYFYFATGLHFVLGKDFSLEFGPGYGRINPRFENKPLIDRTETGINYKFLDWEGKTKEEIELGRTILEAFEKFEKDEELLKKAIGYERRFIEADSRGYKNCLEEAWTHLDGMVQRLKDSTKATRDQEIELFRKMMKAIDNRLAEMN